MESTIQLRFESVNENTQQQAKDLILEGMCEHFGFIDYSMNPDLDHIVKNYIDHGDTFLVGTYNDHIICTGALIREDEHTGRIVRLSVSSEYRRKGLAGIMMEQLERVAVEKEMKSMVLETNKDWHNAIGFYKSYGYHEIERDSTQVHMIKRLLE